MLYHVCAASGVAADTYNTSPAARAGVEIVTELLEVVPLLHVPEVEVRAHALPDAVASDPESSPVVDAPPFGVYFPICIEDVPVTVGADELPVATPVPPITSTSTMVAAAGITHRPEKFAATKAVALCVSLSMMQLRRCGVAVPNDACARAEAAPKHNNRIVFSVILRLPTHANGRPGRNVDANGA